MSMFLVKLGGWLLSPFIVLTNRLDKDKELSFVNFDFGKSIFYNLSKFWKLLLLAMSYKSITSLIQVVGPFIILKSFETKNIDLLTGFCVGILFLKIVQWVLSRYTIYLYNSVCGSLVISAHLFWITRDPVVFGTKSSGESIAKLTRADSSIFTILNKVVEVVPSYFFQISVTSIALGSINYWYSMLFLIAMILVIILNASVSFWKNDYMQSKANKYFDKEREILVENLTKYDLIRSSFATSEQIQKSKEAIRYSNFFDMIAWRLWQHGSQFTEVVLVLIMIGICGLIARSPELTMNPIFAGAFINLFLLIKNFRSLGNDISEFSKACYNLQSLFDYMKGFGKNTIIKEEEFEI